MEHREGHITNAPPMQLSVIAMLAAQTTEQSQLRRADRTDPLVPKEPTMAVDEDADVEAEEVEATLIATAEALEGKIPELQHLRISNIS